MREEHEKRSMRFRCLSCAHNTHDLFASSSRAVHFQSSCDALPLLLSCTFFFFFLLNRVTRVCVFSCVVRKKKMQNIFNLTIYLNDSRSEFTDLPVHERKKVYWALLLIILPVLAVFGNILVIVSVYKEKSLQSVTNYFIVSLAFADLLVAAVVMPFALYFLVNVDWNLSETVCDFWIAFDVTLSTASILNLVAISIDRFIAVTRPIKYATYKSNNRVKWTIAIVWIISVAIGSPIVLGLNTSPERTPELCIFYNSDFIIYSSLGSFYIPCVLMVLLYYRIFKAIRKRAKKKIGSGGAENSAGMMTTTAAEADEQHSAVVLENVSQTGRFQKHEISAITNSSIPLRSLAGVGILTTRTIAHEGEKAVARHVEDHVEHNDDDDDSQDEEQQHNNDSSGSEGVDCHVIRNKNTGPNLQKRDRDETRYGHSLTGRRMEKESAHHDEEDQEVKRMDQRIEVTATSTATNGNPDSGYVPAHIEETQFCLRNPNIDLRDDEEEEDEDEEDGGEKEDEEETERELEDTTIRRGRRAAKERVVTGVRCFRTDSSFSAEGSTSRAASAGNLRTQQSSPDARIPAARQTKKKLRFNLRRKSRDQHRMKKNREKTAAKLERKATKTLAIVLGKYRHELFRQKGPQVSKSLTMCSKPKSFSFLPNRSCLRRSLSLFILHLSVATSIYLSC